MVDSPAAESPWCRYFVKILSPYNGYGTSMEDANNLLKSFEIATVTKYSISKTDRKNFGHMG